MTAIGFSILYSLVLAAHYLYARHVIKRNLFTLAMGPMTSPTAILAGLLILNGFSLLAFIWENPIWILCHIGLHLLLAGDEAFRLRIVRQRWPFFVNHLLFVWILAEFLVFIRR